MPPVPATAQTVRRSELRHVPALDGLRGLGVLGILLFHAGHLPGGWLGVDLFFVLSGFLITSLLLVENETAGRISLPRFWGRRARRLIPALLLALLGVCAYAALLAAPEQRAGIRADALATLFYIANWHEIVAGRDYWELFLAPSPLDHTWSLAIEEQFYLAWPPIGALLLTTAAGSPRRLAVVAGGLAVASAVWMAVLFDPVDGTARVYYGTDARVFAILVGAALAPVLRPFTQARGPAAPRPRERLADVLAVTSLMILGGAWTQLSGQEPWLYRGGLFALALCGAFAIGGIVVADRGLAARLMGLAPLRGLGVISYGVYLWHWPVYVVLSPARLPFDGAALTIVRIGVTLGISLASYRWVEAPIRRGGRGAPGALGTLGTLSGWRAASAAVGAMTVVAAATMLATQVAAPREPQHENVLTSPIGAEGLDVLMLGDSVAFKLADSFKAMAEERSIRADTRAAFGCSVLPGPRIRLRDGAVLQLDQCAEARAAWRDVAIRLRPRVVLILEGWHGYGARWLDDDWGSPCEAVHDARYAEALDAEIARFDALGLLSVIVAAAPPDVHALSDSTPRWQDESAADLDREFQRRLQCSNHVRRQVATRRGAVVLDLSDFVCRDGDCRNTASPLRPDGLHFSEEGARAASGWLLDQLDEMQLWASPPEVGDEPDEE